MTKETRPGDRACAARRNKRFDASELEIVDIMGRYFSPQFITWESTSDSARITVNTPDHLIVVEHKDKINKLVLQQVIEHFEGWKAKLPKQLLSAPECWLVGNRVSTEALETVAKAYSAQRVLVLTIDDLRKKLEAVELDRKTKKIATAVTANKEQLLTACESLGLLIDEKLANLRAARPNSAAAISGRDDEIEDLERLHRDLGKLKNLISSNKTGKPVEESVISFRDGLQRWWNKHHEKICARGFDLALFLSAVTVCSVAGAGGPVAVVISGALVGGKSVADALRAAGKRLWKS